MIGQSLRVTVSISALVLCLFCSRPGKAMTVEEAYQAIPHQRTVFDVRKAKMSQEEKKYLQELFELVDQAIVQRIELLLWLQRGGKSSFPKREYEAKGKEILVRFNALQPPNRQLDRVREMIVKAIIEQQQYLGEWRKAVERGTRYQFRLGLDPHFHPLVLRSSQKLQQAYGELMRLYAQEGAHNRQSFFDYPCALDFK